MRGEIVPPSKVIVNKKSPPRGVLIKGEEHLGSNKVIPTPDFRILHMKEHTGKHRKTKNSLAAEIWVRG